MLWPRHFQVAAVIGAMTNGPPRLHTQNQLVLEEIRLGVVGIEYSYGRIREVVRLALFEPTFRPGAGETGGFRKR